MYGGTRRHVEPDEEHVRIISLRSVADRVAILQLHGHLAHEGSRDGGAFCIYTYVGLGGGGEWKRKPWPVNERPGRIALFVVAVHISLSTRTSGRRRDAATPSRRFKMRSICYDREERHPKATARLVEFGNEGCLIRWNGVGLAANDELSTGATAYVDISKRIEGARLSAVESTATETFRPKRLSMWPGVEKWGGRGGRWMSDSVPLSHSQAIVWVSR